VAGAAAGEAVGTGADGVSDIQLICRFDFNGIRFIFLWIGKYDYLDPKLGRLTTSLRRREETTAGVAG
jgi:hypothetical protein